MNYSIVNTSLMVKGRNYPEGGKISDSVLSTQDIKDLSKYLKPIDNKNVQQVKSKIPPVDNKKTKTSRRNERILK